MTSQEFKAAVNAALDEVAQRDLDRPLTHSERQHWWVSKQAGYAEPYLLMIGGTDEQREAVLQAAREWTP